MLPQSRMAMVPPTPSLVDPLHPRAHLFPLFFISQPPSMAQHSTSRHGLFLLPRLCRQPRCEPIDFKSWGYCICFWGFSHWIMRKCVLEVGGWDSVYGYGDWGAVLSSGKVFLFFCFFNSFISFSFHQNPAFFPFSLSSCARPCLFSDIMFFSLNSLRSVTVEV